MTQPSAPPLTSPGDFAWATTPTQPPANISPSAAREAEVLNDVAVDQLLAGISPFTEGDDPMTRDALVAASRDGQCTSLDEHEAAGLGSDRVLGLSQGEIPDYLRSTMD